ncbi:MAG: NAD(P)-dependent glycerol-3-phosphate dehydrogenase, partial [Gracilibacteraceae bacterium]|nr:NAD(P)-dependent glycerol-3-phosphate dehydrogenase [Gracilibacteraceae bacterium]
MKRVAVWGSGSWGTAIAYTLASAGNRADLSGRSEDAEIIRGIERDRENIRFLPGVFLPDSVRAITELSGYTYDFLFLAVPSHAVREAAHHVKPFCSANTIVVNLAKGLEEGSCLRLSEVVQQVLPSCPVVVLSGPSHAEEVGREVATAVVAASADEKAAVAVQELIMTPFFRVYVNSDVVGVELGGALKNVIALCSGALEGRQATRDNTKAALITRGLTEITRLGVALGAREITFSGLAGLGDLVVTCTSSHSRNLRAGRALATGKPLTQVLDEIGMVVEGVRATRAAYELSRRLNISMPITEKAYQVLFENAPVESVIQELMARSKKHEH